MIFNFLIIKARFFFIFFNVILGFLIFYAKAQEAFTSNFIIQKIEIKTDNLTLKQYIQDKVSNYENKVFSKILSEKIQNEILNALVKKKILLPKISSPEFSFKKGYVNIVYEIKHPYRYGFILKGNKELDIYTLALKKQYIKYFNNSQLIQKLVSYIKMAYLKKGYKNIQLSYNIHTDSKHFIKSVFISIEEGIQTKIKNIKILGQFSKPDKYYVRFLKNHSGFLAKKNIFNNQDINEGVKSLVNVLKNQGYFKARAQYRIKDVSDNQVVVEVILNEGPFVRVTSISLKGNQYFSNKELLRLMQIKKDKALNVLFLEEDIISIINKYQEAGFINVKINNQQEVVKYNAKSNEAELYFDIEEGAQIKILEIIVKGNTRVKTDFILKNLDLNKGDILTPQKIEKATNSLRSLGLFSFINFLIKVPDSPILKEQKNQKHLLIVQVKERKPRSLRFSIGVHTENASIAPEITESVNRDIFSTIKLTVRGLTEFSHRNIDGSGRNILSKLKLQSNIIQLTNTGNDFLEHQLDLSYVEPFLFNTKINGYIYLSHSSEIFSELKKDITDVVNATQIELLLKLKILDFMNLTYSIFKWEGRTEFEKTAKCSTVFFLSNRTCHNSTLNIVSTVVNFSVDRRNSVLYPSDGFFSQVFIEYAGPIYFIDFSDKIRFVKIEFKHIDYRSLSHSWIWLNSLQGGVITSFHPVERGGIPVSRAFILGGVNSLRGFNGNFDGERVPDKNDLPIDKPNDLIDSRSSLYFLFKTELRFTINDHFMGSLFYDGGLVTLSGRKFDRPYRQSTGMGLRYKTPLGAISGYLAFKIFPKEKEATVTPHFSFSSL